MSHQHVTRHEALRLYLWARLGCRSDSRSDSPADLDTLVSKALSRLDNDARVDQMVTYDSSRDHLTGGQYFHNLMLRLMETEGDE